MDHLDERPRLDTGDRGAPAEPFFCCVGVGDKVIGIIVRGLFLSEKKKIKLWDVQKADDFGPSWTLALYDTILSQRCTTN